MCGLVYSVSALIFMITITLPDGSQRQFPETPTVQAVAASIGAGLAKAALAGKVDGRLVDLNHVIDHDASVAIITEKNPEGLEVIRHSTAHLLAQAVKQLFPAAQVTIGPVIEDGFYYDFALEKPLTPEDLEKIEAKMLELAKLDQIVTRKELSRDEAVKFFEAQGEHYKAEIIRDIPANEALSLYTQGEFTDLCRGPHVPNTGKLKAFKLMKVAGAYWRGDSKNAMLQRVYGTAWLDAKALQEYLHRLEEAEKRDHRKIGKAMDLFHLQEEAPGMVFWHPRGWTLYSTVTAYVQKMQREANYREIRTPQIVDVSLWEKSGHLALFGENMFFTESEKRNYAIKPMNCPCHVQVFNQGLKSYRDLPIRFAEFGACHRNEMAGALHGIMRVRGFVQDDGHIFCTEEQIATESKDFIDFLYRIYQDFGFNEVIVKLSMRPEKRFGDDALWDLAENALAKVLDDKNIPWEAQPGEGAFYGPKIEFSLKDCLGRVWQCGTLQLDFVLPQRLGASYIAEDGSRKTPVMLHRAALGSVERFIGILLEHYAGRLPTWLAPVQAVVMCISEKQQEYTLQIEKQLRQKGFRVESDLRNEKIGFKIRAHTLEKVPYLIVIGDREVEQNLLSVRTQQGQDLGQMTLEEFADKLIQ